MGYLIGFLFPALLVAAALGAAAGWELHRVRTRGRLDTLAAQREREIRRLLLAADPETPARIAAEAQAQIRALQDQITFLQSRISGSEAERARLTEEVRQAREAAALGQRQLAEARGGAAARDQALSQEVLQLREQLRQAGPANAPSQTPEPARAPGGRVLRAAFLEARLRWLEGRRKAQPASAPAPAATTAGASDAEIAALRARIAQLEAQTPESLEEEATRLKWQNRYLAARNRRLETLLMEGAPPLPAPPQPAPPQPATQTAPPDRRSYWRGQYLEARLRHLEAGAARQAAARPAAEALARERDEARAEASRLKAILAQRIAAEGPPSGFETGAAAWTSQATGPAHEAPDLSGWTIEQDAEGALAQAAGGFRELRPKALVRLEPGRVYRVSARVRQARDAANGGGQWAGIDAFPALDANFGAVPAEAAPRLADIEGAPRTAALAAGAGWVRLAAQMTAPESGPGVWARPRVYVNWRGDRPIIGDGVAQVAEFRIEEIRPEAGAEAGAAQGEPMKETSPEAALAARRTLWRERYLAARVRRLEALLQERAEAAPSAPTPAAAQTPAPAPARTVEAPAPETAPKRPRRPPERLPAPRGGLPDDLRRLAGVDPNLERALNDAGIFHYDQIALWTPENVAWVDRHLTLRGRIEEEAWVSQAKTLAAQGYS